MAAEQNKDQGAITPASGAASGTAVKSHKEHKGPSVKDHLTQALDFVKKNTPPRTGLYVALALGALLIFLLFRYFWLSSAATVSDRWARLAQAVYVSQVEAIASDPELKDTDQARMARLIEARMRLDGGLKSLGVNHVQALKELETARTIYTELTKSPGRVPLIQQEALWGAAKANEALGNDAAAIELYNQLRKEHDGSALARDAKNQLERLNDPAGKKDRDELREVLKLNKAG